MSSLVVEAALARYGREHNRYLRVADAVALTLQGRME